MSASADGLFQAYINRRAYRPTTEDRALMSRLCAVTPTVLEASQVRWAGSQRKGTGIEGSDLDTIVESRDPVTEAQRRTLRGVLEAELGRPARIQSHVIRLPVHEGSQKVDVAFSNAAFGSRLLPDVAAFHSKPNRQAAARGVKLWTRARNLTFVSGWAVEALVLHLDTPEAERGSLELFLRIIGWLDRSASAASMEAVLRPTAYPRWNSRWSARLPGRIEALRNHARALLGRGDPATTWTKEDDVGLWFDQ